MNIDHIDCHEDWGTYRTLVTPTTKYEPWTDGQAIGLKVTRVADGKVQYIFLNPSIDEDPTSTPDVFLYIGPNGDPAQDGAAHYYDMTMED